MRVWLVTIGEPLPIDKDPRLYRTGQLAEKLLAAGHEVTWWTSTFDHSNRTQRHTTETRTVIREGYRLVELFGMSYRRSVSARRVANHYQLARNFASAIRAEPVPDIVLSSLPTVELCEVATTYGARHRVPVVLDMRDMWPDIFAELAPLWAQGAARVALWPLQLAVRRTCAAATAITGITDPFVDWGVAHAGRARGTNDRAFPHGYNAVVPPTSVLAEAREFWCARGVSEASGDFVVCFFGAIGRQFDLGTVIDAARMLEARGRRFKFVICGNGDDLERYRRMAEGHPSVVLPGWINRGQIWALMDLSSVGIAPYVGGMGYESSYPNKTIEYLCGGLPCACSLGGLVQDLLTETDCGFFYANGDPHGLESQLLALADNPTRLARMKSNARRVFDERFVADKVYGEMAHYLEHVARNRRG